MNRTLEKIKVFTKDKKKVVVLLVILFLLLGLSFTVLYLTNRDSSFDSRSRASNTPSLGPENVNGDFNDDGKVSMEDFRLWLGFYRGYKGHKDITFKSISSGSHHSCGLDSSGNGYCWGYNKHGELGNGSTTDSNTPVLVSQGVRPAEVTFSSISAGSSYTCALGTDGNAYCWGYNVYGQLGNGSLDSSNVPVLVSQGERPTGVTFSSISAGSSHTCALGTDGNAYCWGCGRLGKLGNGASGPEADSNVPVLVSQGERPAGVTFSSISVGSSHTCAVGSDGNGYCWGYSYNGLLGNGSTTNSNTAHSTTPVLVSQGARPAGVTFSSISASWRHTCGIGSDGNGYCWGDSGGGGLGDGTRFYGVSNIPVLVSQGERPAGVTFISISVGGLGGNTCGIGSDGNGYCWGYNVYGQLGNGSLDSSNVPVLVSQGERPTGVTFVSIGVQESRTCGVGSDGNGYCWGGGRHNVPVLVKQGEYKKGDLNNDGKVNIEEDFILWLQAYREYKRRN